MQDATYPRYYDTRPGPADLRTMGDTTRGSPIPLQGGIKAHTLCEENVHLRHIRRLFEALQSVRISLLRRACLFPLQGSPAFLLPAPRSCAVVFLMYNRQAHGPDVHKKHNIHWN
jgi:hypothetical protein